NPELPPALDLSLIDAEVLTNTPDRLLGLASDLLVAADVAHGGQCLELLERVQSSIAPESRLAAHVAVARSFHAMLAGQAQAAVREGLAAWAVPVPEGLLDFLEDVLQLLQLGSQLVDPHADVGEPQVGLLLGGDRQVAEAAVLVG